MRTVDEWNAEYERRCSAMEAEGMDRSDAQAVLDLAILRANGLSPKDGWYAKPMMRFPD